MENGVIIEQGTVLDIFSNPQQQTTRNFIKTIFDDEVPGEILAKIKPSGPVSKILRVAFRGDAALDPVLGTLSARFPVSTNLLYGSITSIKGTALGILLLHISGEERAIEDGIAFLRESVYRVDIVEREEGTHSWTALLK